MTNQSYIELNSIALENRIEGDEYDDLITISRNVAASYRGHNHITTGQGDDQVLVGGRLEATWLGSNTIEMGDGHNILTIDQEILANNATNLIRFGANSSDEASFLSAQGNMLARNTGNNTVEFAAGKHALSVASVQAIEGAVNEIRGLSGNSLDLQVDNGFKAHSNSSNIISVNQGAGSYRLDISDGLEATTGGRNSFNLYIDDFNAVIRGDIDALNGGRNNLRIFATQQEESSASLVIHGDINAATQSMTSSNEIHLLAQASAELLVYGTLTSTSGTYNDLYIRSEGSSTVEIQDGIRSDQGYSNILISGQESSQLTVQGSIEASGRSNHIQLNDADHTRLVIDNTGGIALHANALDHPDPYNNGSNQVTFNNASDSEVIINGDVVSENGGVNQLRFYGDGDTHISLFGKVDSGALNIISGSGYDVLALHAGNHLQFNDNYQDWLMGQFANDTLKSMNVDSIRVDIGSPTVTGLNNLAWLDVITTAHNSLETNPIELELNIDKAYTDLSLSDLFSSDRNDLFVGLDMAGEYSNTLNVAGTLDDNGITGDTLRILGDSNDTVTLSGGWSLEQSGVAGVGGMIFDVYQNATDQLLIQNTLSVI